MRSHWRGVLHGGMEWYFVYFLIHWGLCDGVGGDFKGIVAGGGGCVK